MAKRRLYKENNELVLNDDGSVKTLEQKINELNEFVKTVMDELESEFEILGKNDPLLQA